MPRLLADVTPLRTSVAFRRMWLGTSLSGIGTALTSVAVGLQVYDITGQTSSVGLVGLAGLVPLVVLGLYGGAISDAHDRRAVILLTAAGLLVTSVLLAAQAFAGLDDVRVLYAIVALQSGFFALNQPARAATVPKLVGLPLLPAANALSGLSFALALAVGPLVAGALVGWAGYGWTYSVEVVLLLVALLSLRGLPALPPDGEVRRAGLRSVLEGLQHLSTRPTTRGTFVVDLFAMVFAMPRVLFPAVGVAIIGGGATTVGVLTAGMAVGSLLAGLLSGPLGRVRRQGVAIVGAILVWGAAVVVFGLVLVASPGAVEGDPAHWTLWPATAAMVVAGAADTVSSIFRSTVLQAATPDALRGRLQGVFTVVVAGGPRLGDVVVGGLAGLAGEAVAGVVGGVACVVAVLVFAAVQPRFRRYDALHPTP